MAKTDIWPSAPIQPSDSGRPLQRTNPSVTLVVDGLPQGAPEDYTVTQLLADLDANPNMIGLLSFDQPDEADLEELIESMDWHPVMVEDLTMARQRSKVERHGEALFLVVRPAGYVDIDEDIVVGEYHVVMHRNLIVLARQGLHGGANQRFTRAFRPDHELLQHGPEALLYAIIDAVVDTYFPVLYGISNDVEQIERQVFSGDPDAPERIYRLYREVIDFQHAAHPLVEVLDDLSGGFDKYTVPEELQAYLEDVQDHLLRVNSRMASNRDLLNQILTVNATLVAERQNEDMKRVSSWAAMLVVPTVVSGIYGMNFTHMPELDWAYGYPMALILMFALSLGLYFLFKRRNWL
ncbi:magnesium and cobalt transport protein CorA [Stomatohabitans albus]|uniref:magnesium and cobalt transport protein CorA n=1 Tax=Stomatohabitans albus TaxID=3110766 RepID=UPI00300C1BF8